MKTKIRILSGIEGNDLRLHTGGVVDEKLIVIKAVNGDASILVTVTKRELLNSVSFLCAPNKYRLE